MKSKKSKKEVKKEETKKDIKSILMSNGKLFFLGVALIASSIVGVLCHLDADVESVEDVEGTEVEDTIKVKTDSLI